MGRRKIAIEPISEERNRTVTFVKRKLGLFKKAHELSILCQVDVLVIIVGHNHKVYEFSSADKDELFARYQNAPRIQELKKPRDYGDYETVSRISEFPGKKKNGQNSALGKKMMRALQLQMVQNTPNNDDDDEEDDDLILDFDEDDDDDDEEDDSITNNTSKPQSNPTAPTSNDPNDQFLALRNSSSALTKKRSLLLTQNTPSKPSKLRRKLSKLNLASNAAAGSPGIGSLDQSKIQSTFQHQRALLLQQHQHSSAASALPPLTTFQNQPSQSGSPPHMKYFAGPGAPTNSSASQYAPSPLYSSTSSNGGSGSTGGALAGRSSSHRPVLRVQIPSTTADDGAGNAKNDANDTSLKVVDDPRGAGGSSKNDSAMTLTALDSSTRNELAKDDDEKQEPRNGHQLGLEKLANQLHHGYHQVGAGAAPPLAPPKPILPGLGTNSANTSSQNVVASQNSSNNNSANSPKSTPISLTLPNGFFILPQPQPSPSGSHTNNIFPSPFNNNPGAGSSYAGNTNSSSNNVNANAKYLSFVQQQQQQQSMLFNGETPLSALPSKYLNNDLLFLSPSNFYSSEWNIPFGSGGTPILTSRNMQSLTLVLLANNSSNNSNSNNNIDTSGGTLSAIIRDNNSIMLPSPSQMMGNVFSGINGGASGNGSSNNGGSNKRGQ